MHITSGDNPKLKLLARLQKTPAAYRTAGVVLLEGEHLWREFVQYGQARYGVQALFVSAENEAGEASVAGFEHLKHTVPHALLSRFASGSAPFHRIALLTQNNLAAERIYSSSTINCVVLDGVQDAGNVGTLLRTAAGAGAARVLLGAGCAAAWSPKVTRAARGAHFHLSVEEFRDTPALIAALAAAGGPLYAADVRGSETLFSAKLATPCNWVFGNEGQGVSAELLAACNERVRIPQVGPQSLNVSAAAAICLFDMVRRSRVTEQN
jgi:RNA methyltransferase, TrmH family